MQSLAQKTRELKAKHKDELKALALKESTFKKLGIECIAYSSKSIGFFGRKNEYVNSKGVNSKEDVRNILKDFPVGEENFVLRFAGRDSETTKSPFELRVDNYTHNREPEGKLKYTSDKGIDISIELNSNVIEFNTINKLVNPRSYARNPETFSMYSLKDHKLECQVYGTTSEARHYAYHGEAKNFLDLFKA